MRLRKLALTVHVTCSVGWLGAVVGFLVLAVAGLIGDEPQRVRAAYLAMDLIGWYVIVPAAIASLVTGVIQALATEWGLLRHYWVAIKLVLTIVATVVLLVHMQPIGHVAARAAEATLSPGDLQAVRIQLVVETAAGLVVLIVATALSVYKPRGATRFGRA